MTSASVATSYPHILLLGSTGRSGRLLLSEALSQGYTVTALARDPTALSTFTDDRLTIAKGTPTSSSDLLSALQQSLDARVSSDPDHRLAIVSTLGQTRETGSPFSRPTSPPLFMAQSMTALLDAIRALPTSSRARIHKLVVMSMFGAGDSFANLHFALKPVMRCTSMAQTVDDHNSVDAIVRSQTEAPWVMVRPAMLKEGTKKDLVVRGDDGKGEGWMPSSVMIRNVVDFLLQCVVSQEWNGRAPVIVN